MIQRHNMIVCLALLVMLACDSVADAGSFCGRRAGCGRNSRLVRTCVAPCWPESGMVCTGRGPTCEIAMQKAQANCSEPIVMCTCVWEINRKRCFGRCLVKIREMPVCGGCMPGAAEKAAAMLVKARCPTGNGEYCYGSGATCDEAKRDAAAHCSKPITGPCICWEQAKRKRTVTEHCH